MCVCVCVCELIKPKKIHISQFRVFRLTISCINCMIIR